MKDKQAASTSHRSGTPDSFGVLELLHARLGEAVPQRMAADSSVMLSSDQGQQQQPQQSLSYSAIPDDYSEEQPESLFDRTVRRASAAVSNESMEEGSGETDSDGSCPPEGRKVRASQHITYEDLRKVFSLSRAQAANSLRISTNCLKRMCRKKGIDRWPHRKIRSLENLAESCRKSSKDPEEKQALLLAIAHERERVIHNPNHEVDTTLAHMRTLNYKKRYATKRKLTKGRGGRGGGSTGSEGGTHQARPTALAALLHPHPLVPQGAPSSSMGPHSAVSGSMLGSHDVGQGAGEAPGLLGQPGKCRSHSHSPSPGIGVGLNSAAVSRPAVIPALVNRQEGAQALPAAALGSTTARGLQQKSLSLPPEPALQRHTPTFHRLSADSSLSSVAQAGVQGLGLKQPSLRLPESPLQRQQQQQQQQQPSHTSGVGHSVGQVRAAPAPNRASQINSQARVGSLPLAAPDHNPMSSNSGAVGGGQAGQGPQLSCALPVAQGLTNAPSQPPAVALRRHHPPPSCTILGVAPTPADAPGTLSLASALGLGWGEGGGRGRGGGEREPNQRRDTNPNPNPNAHSTSLDSDLCLDLKSTLLARTSLHLDALRSPSPPPPALAPASSPLWLQHPGPLAPAPPWLGRAPQALGHATRGGTAPFILPSNASFQVPSVAGGWSMVDTASSLHAPTFGVQQNQEVADGSGGPLQAQGPYMRAAVGEGYGMSVMGFETENLSLAQDLSFASLSGSNGGRAPAGMRGLAMPTAAPPPTTQQHMPSPSSQDLAHTSHRHTITGHVWGQPSMAGSHSEGRPGSAASNPFVTMSATQENTEIETGPAGGDRAGAPKPLPALFLFPPLHKLAPVGEDAGGLEAVGFSDGGSGLGVHVSGVTQVVAEVAAGALAASSTGVGGDMSCWSLATKSAPCPLVGNEEMWEMRAEDGEGAVAGGGAAGRVARSQSLRGARGQGNIMACCADSQPSRWEPLDQGTGRFEFQGEQISQKQQQQGAGFGGGGEAGGFGHASWPPLPAQQRQVGVGRMQPGTHTLSVASDPHTHVGGGVEGGAGLVTHTSLQPPTFPRLLDKLAHNLMDFWLQQQQQQQQQGWGQQQQQQGLPQHQLPRQPEEQQSHCHRAAALVPLPLPVQHHHLTHCHHHHHPRQQQQPHQQQHQQHLHHHEWHTLRQEAGGHAGALDRGTHAHHMGAGPIAARAVDAAPAHQDLNPGGEVSELHPSLAPDYSHLLPPLFDFPDFEDMMDQLRSSCDWL